MTISENDIDEIVLNLLSECEDIDPPLSRTEIITLFNERIILESEAMVTSSLLRLVEKNKVETRSDAYRIRGNPAAA